MKIPSNSKLLSLVLALLSVAAPGSAFLLPDQKIRPRLPMPQNVGLSRRLTFSPIKETSPHLRSSLQEESSTTEGEFFPFLEDTPVASVPQAPNVGLSGEALGFLALFSVPVIWGTYVPVVRLLYEIDPAVPGFIFSAMYFVVASISCLALLAFFPAVDGDGTDEDKTTKAMSVSTEATDKNRSDLPIMNLPIAGGAEIGTYVFLGNSMQVIGLETVPADRAGFLVQLSTIFVPLVEAAMKGNPSAISARTWIACCVALAGIAVMGLDSSGTGTIDSLEEAIRASSSMFSGFGSGDFLTMGAALMYSMSVIRVSKYANETTPMRLTASKATMEMILSLALVAGCVYSATHGYQANSGWLAFVQESGQEMITFFDTVRERYSDGTLPMDSVAKVAGATLYTGWIATAFLIYAQSYGQKRVKASDANLIYSMQPLFTALFAFLLLGDRMEPIGYVGGSLIAGAVFLVASKSQSEDDAAEA